MNTNRLAQMYDRLTAKERLPLVLNAEKRGDTAEKKRLANSAPPTFGKCPIICPVFWH